MVGTTPILDPALELIAAHCDIEERLQASPPSARVRGVWFRVLTTQLEKRGLLPRYRELFPADDFGSLRFVWVGDFLVRAAVAGALVSGTDRLHDGLFEISRDNAKSFASSLLGRSLFRLLSNDPKKLTQQATATTRQTTNYGKWTATYPDDRTVEMRFHQEYVWIESYLRGAAVGTYEALERDCTVEVRLEDPFNGAHIIRFAEPIG